MSTMLPRTPPSRNGAHTWVLSARTGIVGSRSFLRKRESDSWTADFRRSAGWIPAFAGMTGASNLPKYLTRQGLGSRPNVQAQRLKAELLVYISDLKPIGLVEAGL